MRYTYGIELELADVDRRVNLPGGMSWAKKEKTLVNSDGRAIDCTGKHHTIGGEVNTPPTDTPEEQYEFVKQVNQLFPNAAINHRCNLHCHLTYPGLSSDLAAQKKILTYARDNSEYLFEKYFTPVRHPDMDKVAWNYVAGDRSIMPRWRYDFCMASSTIEEFKLAHSRIKDGTIYPKTIKRYGVNLYSMFKHGTVEFRSIFGTKDPNEVQDCLRFFTIFMDAALSSEQTPLNELIDWDEFHFPKQVPYSHHLETCFRKDSQRY